MAKTEMTTIPSSDIAARPEFLDEFTDSSMNETLDQYIRPPRIKAVQGTAKPPLSERFNPGDVCFMPAAMPVVAKGKPFWFTPLFFFPEWMTFNPLGAEMTIRERSFDPTSDIAVKSRKKETRRETCPETPDKMMTHNAFLNFICMLQGDHDLNGTTFVMSFKGAEYKSGSNLGSMIKMRNAPMIAQVFEAKTSQRTNPNGQWWGFDIGSPSAESGVDPWIRDRDLMVAYKKAFDGFKEAHANNLIQIDVDEDSTEEAAPAGKAEF